jgi:small-conductance mechanosensitive channel
MTRPHRGIRSPVPVILAILLAALICRANLSARQAPQAPPPETPGGETATAPVEFDGTVLFQLRGVTSLPADARAARVRERLYAVAADDSVPADSLQVVEADGLSHIRAGETPILVVSDADAALELLPRPQLAAVHRARIQQAIVDYRAARAAPALRRAALDTLLGTVVLVLAIGVLVWTWRRIDRLFTRRLEARIHTVGIQSFEVMRAEQIAAALRNAMFTVRLVIYTTLAFVYLGFVLAQWPWTRGTSRNMLAFALAPLQVIGGGIVEHIPGLTFLVVLFVAVRVLLRLVRLFFDAVERGGVTLQNFDAEWAQPTYKIIRLAIVAFALIVAYPYIPGSDSAAFRGISVFLGILFSLGSSSAIANIVAGYMMTYRRAFKVGDRVKIGDVVGDVIETRLQVTHLKSIKNEEFVIPNAHILGTEVMNYSTLAGTRGLILHTEVSIGYDTPWRQVEAMLLDAAARTSGILQDPRPFVLEKRLGDFAVTYELNGYSRSVQAMAQIYAEMHRNILDVFNEHGVQIMVPAYESDLPPQNSFASAGTAPRLSRAELGTPAKG